jgi:hypothetical protein
LQEKVKDSAPTPEDSALLPTIKKESLLLISLPSLFPALSSGDA